MIIYKFKLYIYQTTLSRVFGLTAKVRTLMDYEKCENYKQRTERIFMISINKEEAKAIREYLPSIHIVRTMKQKSKRKHYFCEESGQAIKFLNAMRNRGLMEKKENKVGKKDVYRKKA